MAATSGSMPEHDYVGETEKLKGFIQDYQETDMSGDQVHKYMLILQNVANRRERLVRVDLDDVYDSLGDEIGEAISTNTKRYQRLLADAIDQVMPEPTESDFPEDVADILTRSRQQQAADGTDADTNDSNQGVPQSLTRRYEVLVMPRVKEKAVPLRQVRASRIGNLLTVKGIVTRVSEVKPSIAVATYTCAKGGFEVYQEVMSRSFMPLHTCPASNCCGATGRLHLQTRGCKFLKFQEVKIQEEADEVPVGHVPRQLTVHLYGELTRSCSAGDVVTVSGIFLPVPYAGFKAIRAGLITDTYLEAQSVEKHKKSYVDFTPTAEVQQRIEDAIASDDLYNKMAQSIAPEIFGHEDVKKALLLLLVGGATRQMEDGMKIRGDINVCLMGDPGVAKSQLLKHIATVAPRAVYTTGKGSSGVGLTAAVTRDTSTGEMVLEGGALVLADMGICCIDEFDKMEESDRTAIHEVMEQQTVSIAKAGITTTLNARTSVLAAANPVFSKYNPNRTPEENINLPAALLSRFDLLWLILDTPDHDHDKRLAEHVTYVHRYEDPPPLEHEPLDAPFMRAMISHARQYEPKVPQEVSEFIIDEYVRMRQESLQEGATFGFTSARTLLAILRLSQALARLRCAVEVNRDDIVEARRLMTLSRSSVTEAAGGRDDDEGRKKDDPISIVYQIIRNHAQSTGSPAVKIAQILPMVLSRGRTQEDLDRCIEEYEALNVWFVNPQRTLVRFVDGEEDI
jgi:DNA replication licensing factor MCM7